MLWTIFLVLLVLWLVGFIGFHVVAWYIHILLIIALVVSSHPACWRQTSDLKWASFFCPGRYAGTIEEASQSIRCLCHCRQGDDDE